jgi:hypothetical protein
MDTGKPGGGMNTQGGPPGGGPRKNVIKQGSIGGMAAKLGMTENNAVHNRIGKIITLTDINSYILIRN